MTIGKSMMAEAGIKGFGRVALVKQDVHDDLYFQVSPTAPRDIVYSSNLRSGPVGLFTALDADFIVVRADPAPECHIWEQKVTDCRHNPYSYYENFRGTVHQWGRDYSHAPVARDVDSVDWGQYDLVISIDIAVPTRIVAAHPGTCWAYYVSEPCMSFYKQSLVEPQFGYDLFLTLGFQEDLLAHVTDRVLEFPYFLHYVGCFQDLDGTPNPPLSDRHCVSVERHSHRLMTPEERDEITRRVGPPVSEVGTLPHLVSVLRDTKYHIRTDKKAIWGNSFVEAAALGAILLGSYKFLKHRLLLRDMWTNSFEETIALMERLDRDDDLREATRIAQEKRVNELCFLRPLRDLTAAIARLDKSART